jgi:hypothetical protein
MLQLRLQQTIEQNTLVLVVHVVLVELTGLLLRACLAQTETHHWPTGIARSIAQNPVEVFQRLGTRWRPTAWLRPLLGSRNRKPRLVQTSPTSTGDVFELEVHVTHKSVALHILGVSDHGLEVYCQRLIGSDRKVGWVVDRNARSVGHPRSQPDDAMQLAARISHINGGDENPAVRAWKAPPRT